MRLRIKRFFAPLRMTVWAGVLLAALAGCDPEPIPTAFAAESSGQEVAVFDFSVMGYDEPSTKAYSADVEDGLVDRIDIFAYDQDGRIYDHYVIGEYGGGPLDLTQVSFKEKGENGEQRHYLIMANLDPDSARYISFLDNVDLARYPEGFIPWSAGNARVNYPLMGATAFVLFGSATTVSVNLMRYMSKFQIGTISAEFWGDPDLYRNVYVQHIAFVNAWNIVRICQTPPRNFYGETKDIFGPKSSGANAFGSPSYHYYMANCFLEQDQWSTYNMTYADMGLGTFNQGVYGGRGKLNQSYRYIYNYNHMQPKNTINLECPAELKELSQQTWDTNAYLPQLAGKLCSDIDGYLGPLNVNRAFYTLPTKFNVWFQEPAYNADQQNNELRLVLAVKINGTLYFYSKMIKGLNPNMCYKINNITLKGEPGEYANTWIRGGQVTKAAATEDVEQWRVHGNTAEIDNLVL